MAVSAPIWGAVGDRFGRKPMLIRSTLAATLTSG
jgi:MFS family permease